MTVIDFEILIRGQIDPESIAQLGDFDVATAPATTVLVGQTADQAALIGLLTRLRALGLTVVEVHRSPDHLPGPALDAE
jgi:hypothetical protein